jgi:hypothetical protein
MKKSPHKIRTMPITNRIDNGSAKTSNLALA